MLPAGYLTFPGQLSKWRLHAKPGWRSRETVNSVKLNFDAKTEKFIGDDEANKLLTRPYRGPFVVPEKV